MLAPPLCLGAERRCRGSDIRQPPRGQHADPLLGPDFDLAGPLVICRRDGVLLEEVPVDAELFLVDGLDDRGRKIRQLARDATVGLDTLPFAFGADVGKADRQGREKRHPSDDSEESILDGGGEQAWLQSQGWGVRG